MGRSDYLFSSGGFLDGMSRTLDIFGVFDNYNVSSSSEEADRVAIANDWLAVGDDMNHALDSFEIPNRDAKE